MEFDIIRNKEHDLTRKSVQQLLLQKIKGNHYTALVVSPPCDTFSRVKFANRLGPQPSRCFNNLRGFPWIAFAKKQINGLANTLLDFTCMALKAQALNSPGLCLMEFPEDLGAVQHGEWRGTRPASAWQWPEMQEIRHMNGFKEVGLHQHNFGAEHLKPTRILVKGQLAEGIFYEGEPTYDDQGYYTGPIPKLSAAELGLKTLAKQSTDESFRTSGTAAWPGGLCEWTANCLQLGLLQHYIDDALEIGAEDSSYTDQPATSSFTPDTSTEVKNYPVYLPPPGYWVGGTGPPRTTYILGKYDTFHDGAGLSSPGRWTHDKRLLPAGRRWDILREQLLDTIYSETENGSKIGQQGVQRKLLQLCCSKELVVFNDEIILKGRTVLRNWLKKQTGSWNDDEPEVPDFQPFALKLLHLLLVEMRDPDAEVIEQLKHGVTAGVLEPLPRTPAIYEEQASWRLSWNELTTPDLWTDNYASLEDHKEQVLLQFREEAELGLMKEYSESDFKAKFGNDIAVSALAVIVEDSGDKIRVLLDATHGTCVNNRIRCRDKLRMPSVKERHTLMRERRSRGEIPLSLLADFSKAHRWVRIKEREHGLLACQVEPGRVWTNTCGTFGVSSAAYWWSRLSGALVRATHGVLGYKYLLDILLYADDLEMSASNAHEREGIVLAIYFMLVMGAPLKWKKFRGGFKVDWVGIFLDNCSYSVGLSEKRATWMAGWLKNIIKEGTVEVSTFAGGLGRLNFAAMALFFYKPWLGPLYSWTATILRSGKARATIPWGVLFILRWLAEQFENGNRTMVVPDLPKEGGELFRSDAKAEDGEAALGGWECKDNTLPKQARWFYCKIDREHFPWAFVKDNNPQRVIATLELLGTLLSVMVFDYNHTCFQRNHCTITGDTDNQGMSLVTHKLMSTKWPLAPMLMEMSEQMRERKLELHLNWIRRDKNELADALSNGDFSSFDPSLRVPLDPKELKWIVLPRVLVWSKEIYDAAHAPKDKEVVPLETWKRRRLAASKRLKTADPW